MALQPVSSRARIGFIPGSMQAGQDMGYGAGYQGVASLIEDPDPLGFLNYDLARQQNERQGQKFDMLKGLFGKPNFGFSGSGSAQFTPPNTPAPNYISA